ncbi:hypothetical protein T484DRAFT_1605906, partial [Baffinella frigidus]
ALWVAAKHGHTEKARRLLMGGADIEEPGGHAPDLSTPLRVAALSGHHHGLPIARLLLQHGVDVSVPDDSGTTPLSYTAGTGH